MDTNSAEYQYAYMCGNTMQIGHRFCILPIPITWLDVGAVAIHIHAAGLSQHDVVAEVLDLHFLKVEDLLLALLILDLLDLLSETAQHLAATWLLQIDGPAGIRALAGNGGVAGIGQAEVEPAYTAP